ncbi:hypothetical protein EXIGLDRAFT_847851, partial [Exidia glandulosa HHB12029]
MHVRPSALAHSGLYALHHCQDRYKRRSRTGLHGTPMGRDHRSDVRPFCLHHGIESCRRTRVRSLPFASRSPRPWDLSPLTVASPRSPPPPPFAIGSHVRLEVNILLLPRLLGRTRTASHMCYTSSRSSLSPFSLGTILTCARPTWSRGRSGPMSKTIASSLRSATTSATRNASSGRSWLGSWSLKQPTRARSHGSRVS